ncbi:MAG: helix-turn-helix domain-containing protein [Clostridia bacterium]|nr:helix-turn-helix domain-containing protein [Clostridia bacterium]
MNNTDKFTASQIRYMIWLHRLSEHGLGVKNTELADALSVSKPSVHYMLKTLADLGVVTQEAFGLAHFTEEGRALAEQYSTCFSMLEEKLTEFCGVQVIGESAICSALADIPLEIMVRICEGHQ